MTTDLPNWLSLVAGSVIIPSTTYWWTKIRTTSKLPFLEVNIRPARVLMHQDESKESPSTNFPGISITITNKSESSIFISNASISKINGRFVVHKDAKRNIRDNSYELKFKSSNRKGRYDKHEVILKSMKFAVTVIATEKELDKAFFRHAPRTFRSPFHACEHFILEFQVVKNSGMYRMKIRY